MKALSDFRRKVRPLVKSCPSPVIDDAIRDSAIEFCDTTYTWRVELSASHTRADRSDYTINAPKCGRLSKVLVALHNGIEVVPTTELEQDSKNEGWRTGSASIAQYYYMPDRETIRLVLTPTLTESRVLEITATFKPTIDATVLANSLYDDHLEAISHGALMRLYDMPGEDWVNELGAEKRRVLFNKAMRKEKAERLNDYTKESTLTVRPIAYT